MKKRTGLFILILLLLVLFPDRVHADSDLFFDGDSQELFTYEDGLLSTSSTAIAQTEDGFLWIGGYGGLVRYDGRRFEPYGWGELSNIIDLMKGADDTLWIASADRGLVRYQNQEFDYLSEESDLGITAVQSLALAEDGTVWFGTPSGIGTVSPEGEIQKLDIPELSEVFINRILCIAPGEAALVSRDGRLFVWDGKKCEELLFDECQEEIRCITRETETRGYFIGTSGNKLLICDSAFRVQRIIEDDRLQVINDILYKGTDTLWICCDSGIGVYEKGTLRMQRLAMDNSVDRIMVDTEGNYWFVSSRQGILKVCYGTFEDVSRSAGLSGIVANAVVRIGRRIYVGHDDGLLILDARTREEIKDPAYDRLAHVRIRSLYADEDGGLWAATKGAGLLCYSAEGKWSTWTTARHPEIRSDNFRCITKAKGGLLAGTDSGAYLINEKGQVSDIVDNPEDLPFRVLCVVESGDTIYCGTDGYGLYAVRDGKVVFHKTMDNGLSSNVIMKFCLSRTEGNLWMVTGNSITHLDAGGNLKRIEKFPPSNMLDLLITEDEEVLVLTGSGIFRTTEESLYEERVEEFRLFQHDDGLPYEITANSNQFFDGDDLLFCGTGGIAAFHLKDGSEEQRHYQLVIDQVKEDGAAHPMQGAEAYQADAETFRLEFDTHVLTYSLEDPEIFYYLEGFDDDRVVMPLSDLSTVSYTNLDGGNYVFHFGVLSRQTGEVVDEVTLPVIKSLRWHELAPVRAAFAAAAVMLLSLIVYAISKVRSLRESRKVREEYEKKERNRLREIAYTDYLTGCFNRNYMNYWMENILPEAEFPVTFVSLDCNDLKQVNDKYGHERGDDMLAELAALLKKHFTRQGDTIIRTGGDEFLIICCATDTSQAEIVMEKILNEAKEHHIEDYALSFAYGIDTQTKEDFDFDEGMRRSDMELIRAKALYHGRSSQI